MAAVLVAFAHVFRDFGVGSYIRSQKTLTAKSLRAAIGVLFCASWSFALVVFLAAPFAARFYQHSGVEDVMRVLAIGFLFIPIGSIPQAVLARELNVRIPAIVTAASVLAYASSCIILAKLGYSYMSFAWANLINIIVTAGTYSLLQPKDLPRLPSLHGWREVVHFGGGTMLTNSFRSADAAIPDLIIGRLSSAHFVGLFSRANSTVNMLEYIAGPSINFATLPHLVRVHHSGEDVSREVKRIMSYLTGVMWPALAMLACIPQEIIRVLYGPSWLECAVIIPALCIVAASQMSFTVLQPAFTAMGRPYLAASPILVGMVAKGTLAVAMFDGTLYSFAMAFVYGELLAVPANLLLARMALGISPLDWVIATWRSAAAAGAMMAGLILFWPVLTSVEHAALRLLLVALYSLVTWPLVLVVLRHPLVEELLRAKKMVTARLSKT